MYMWCVSVVYLCWNPCFPCVLKVKKEAAAGEKAWEGAGEKPGLEIWRIVKFKVVRCLAVEIYVMHI